MRPLTPLLPGLFGVDANKFVAEREGSIERTVGQENVKVAQ